MICCSGRSVTFYMMVSINYIGSTQITHPEGVFDYTASLHILIYGEDLTSRREIWTTA